jgi:hypothetical protein
VDNLVILINFSFFALNKADDHGNSFQEAPQVDFPGEHEYHPGSHELHTMGEIVGCHRWFTRCRQDYADAPVYQVELWDSGGGGLVLPDGQYVLHESFIA